MTRKRGLGRGLDALLGGAAAGSGPAGDEGELRQIAVDRIQRGQFQPRTQFDQTALQELADSIRNHGLIQPLVVTETVDGLVLIAGERRWRACQLAGLHQLPALVRELDDQSAAAVALIENVQREDLNPLEEARALQRLGDEFELTHQQIATAVGRSRAAVSNLVRLLELTEEVKQMLQCGELEMGHARALLALQGASQIQAANEVVNKRLTVRQAEELVRKRQAPPGPSSAAPAKKEGNADIRALEQELAERLGAVVRIQHGNGGKGRLTIAYTNLDQLEGVLSQLRGPSGAGH